MRVSGAEAARIGQALTDRHDPLQPRHATLCRVRAAAGTSDQVVLTYFPGPHSYTGDDVVEVSAHGSPVLLQAIVSAAMGQGARLAQPGEFTLRAFVRGKIDLVQAEAVADLIEAVTPLQARAAFDQLEGTLTTRIHEIDGQLFDLTARLEASLDFPDEGYHFIEPEETVAALDAIIDRLSALIDSAAQGRLIREGLQVTIAGRPNTGKSSLFNQLAGASRAIVTDIPGTTRDLLTETIDVEGMPITLVDTAGVREVSADPIEVEGIARAVASREIASLIVLVLDRSSVLSADDRALIAQTAAKPRVIVANKIDLPPAAWNGALDGAAVLSVSAVTGEGIPELRSALVSALSDRDPARDVAAVTNIRHADLLARARTTLLEARRAAGAETPEEFVLADLGDARARLEEVTGARTSEDILRAIFQRFCIGK